MATGAKREGLLSNRSVTADGHDTHGKKPWTEVRGHRVIGLSRVCMARRVVVIPGVPRLPPGAFMKTV